MALCKIFGIQKGTPVFTSMPQTSLIKLSLCEYGPQRWKYGKKTMNGQMKLLNELGSRSRG